ncbi:MAG: ankyrin repeat domain-containing protein [Pirellulales bacterium]
MQALLSQNKPMFEALLAYHASPDQCDDSGRCVMNQAATLETPCWLETALAKGGNPDAQNVGNPHVPSRTPIYYTIMRRTFEIDPWRARNAEILIRAGADVDHLNDEGETPLRSAAASGNYEIVVKLLEAGADPALGDPSRLSLVDWFIGRDESMVVHDEQLPWFRKARDILSERGLLGHER